MTSNRAFQALADQTRRDILRMLRNGPLSSGDIAAKFNSSWPTISRHLSVLREAELVLTQRMGQEIYYELNTSVFQDLVHDARNAGLGTLAILWMRTGRDVLVSLFTARLQPVWRPLRSRRSIDCGVRERADRRIRAVPSLRTRR